ncbi:hypothetical protein NQ317_010994 [Molorchus minor]|uniref:Uncharacterized protein n=1 Tax=Molorchus minor TaxID=1323400 RepID=A0ABQ9K2A2_9CUCU|nr:hypothetical protein NQ317_010994 [Molorchus minor]
MQAPLPAPDGDFDKLLSRHLKGNGEYGRSIINFDNFQMKRWYLLLATLAVATATPPMPTKTKHCIDHCTCEENSLPSRLQVISLENVIVERIQESALKDFKYLEDVLIVNSKIGSIDAKAFNGVKRLKFHMCGFEDSPDFFSEKLEEVHFGSCHLEEIPKLNGLLSLTFLNLTGNYIKDVGIEAFDELFDLEELYLSNNEIFKLPPTLFINNQELNSLYLDNNPLKQFYLNTTENLETLSLKNCQLEVFDERSTQKLTTLSELNLSGNKIKELPSTALAHMKYLSVINLSNNRLERLNDDIFAENPLLVKIALDGNNFDTLPNFYLKNGEVFTTYTFSCRNCGLKTLSSTVFEKMGGMIDLQLSENEFMNIDNMFDKIGSLKILDISYNNIAYISPNAFAGNLNLETLNLAGNPLMTLNPEVFANNHVLREIDARNTSLQKLWSNNNKLVHSLQKLLVGNNLLTTVTIDDFKITPNLKAIDLNNNPLIFTDRLCNVINWLDNSEISPIEYNQKLPTNLDLPFYDSIDEFSEMSWNEFYDSKCPEIPSEFVTTPEAGDDDLDESDNDSDSDDSTDEYDVDPDDDDYNYDDEIVADEVSLDQYVQDENDNLARASYILSVTSIFILTALVVLTLAVTITLAILRRNNNFNMHLANLPRLKVPLWYSTPGQKIHSGSVYRPLSEDLSGPKTPKLSRYEFTSSPTVHSNNP